MKNIFLSITVLLLVFFESSCNKDFLDTVPYTSINQTDAFNTPQQYLAHVNNLYSQLQNPVFYGGRFIVFNEQRADEFGQNDGNAATGSAVWNQNVASTSEYINGVWSAAYTAINAANILMLKLSDTKIISDSLSRLYTGEAKFVRALCYLSLVQTFAKPYHVDKSALGVPLRLTAITSDGHNDLARSTVEEVYTQIINDLNDAETLLPTAYSTSLLNATRAHKASAVALKTRVYLNQDNFVKLAEEASKLVPSIAPYVYSEGNVTHKLEPSLSNLWNGSYTGNEAVFSIAFANTTTETPPSQFALAFNYVTQPIIFLSPGGIILDPALSDPLDARSAYIGFDKAKHNILKKFSITTAPFRDYIPVIRYAEVMMNYAEALAHLGQLDESIALIKAVRQRSNPNYNFVNIDFSTSEKIISFILNERRIELLGEGFRLQDLQRLGKNLPAKTGSIGTAVEVPVNASNYIWPIPSGELSANKLCKPN